MEIKKVLEKKKYYTRHINKICKKESNVYNNMS